MDILFYTDNATPRVLASFRFTLTAPWGEQTCCGEIHYWHDGGFRRVMWPKDGRFFATTPATREATERAERYILDAFKTWEARR